MVNKAVCVMHTVKHIFSVTVNLSTLGLLLDQISGLTVNNEIISPSRLERTGCSAMPSPHNTVN